MLILSIILLVFGFFTFVLAMRGRVVAHGAYCAKCGFDLSGLEYKADATPCPECGLRVGPAGTIKSKRRGRSRLGIGLSTAILVIGLGVLGVHVTGKASSIYAVMPNRVVLSASEWGAGDAIDELITRLSAKKQLPDWVWDDAITLALAHQEDLSEQWDPRLGEVMSLAFQSKRLSDEDTGRYLRNGHRVEIWIRPKIRQGDSYVSYYCEYSPSRITGLTRVPTAYTLTLTSSANGITYHTERVPNEQAGGGSMSTSFTIPAPGQSGMGGTGSGVMIPEEVRDAVQVGDTLGVYLEMQLTLHDRAAEQKIEAQPYRHEQDVMVVGDQDSIVDLISDPLAAKQIREGTSIEPFVLNPEGAANSGNKIELANCTMIFTAKPRAVAGTLYLRNHVDGELFEAASIAADAQPVDNVQTTSIRHSQGFSIWMDSGDSERKEAFERVTRLGVVDVIFRSDPDAAEHHAKIDEAVDLEMMFVGVPVVVTGEKSEFSVMNPSDLLTPAQETDEETVEGDG